MALRLCPPKGCRAGADRDPRPLDASSYVEPAKLTPERYLVAEWLPPVERRGRVTRNATDIADPPPSRGRGRASAWTAAELRRFLDQVEGDLLVALWRLAATTGMRRGELAGLTWRC